jgi:hypothetical protein
MAVVWSLIVMLMIVVVVFVVVREVDELSVEHKNVV